MERVHFQSIKSYTINNKTFGIIGQRVKYIETSNMMNEVNMQNLTISRELREFHVPKITEKITLPLKRVFFLVLTSRMKMMAWLLDVGKLQEEVHFH